MSEICPENLESVEDAEQTFPDENDALNGTFNGSPGPKLDKNNWPYVCNHKSCNRKNFSNKSGLERHKREVHSSQHFTCPVPSCSRSKKGFHRRYNLITHQRRVHGSQSSNSPQGPYNNLGDLLEGEETTPSPPYEMEPKEANRDIGVADAELNTREGFKIKLRGLRAMRAELNADIKSMERALSIMGGED